MGARLRDWKRRLTRGDAGGSERAAEEHERYEETLERHPHSRDQDGRLRQEEGRIRHDTPPGSEQTAG